MIEETHISHSFFERDGRVLLAHDQGHSFAAIGEADGVTKQEAYRRANMARARGWDVLGVGKSLDIRAVNHVLDNYPEAASVTLREDGIRRLDLSPEKILAKVEADALAGVKPRWIRLDTLRTWARGVLEIAS